MKLSFKLYRTVTLPAADVAGDLRDRGEDRPGDRGQDAEGLLPVRPTS